MLLYRYFGADRALDFLRTLRLFFTSPKYFNDINELSPFVIKTFSQTEYLNHFITKDYLRPVFESWTNAGLFSGTLEQFMRRARTDPKVEQEVHSRVAWACTGLQKHFKDVMSEHTAVCCLSELPTSNLMWAHYADSHKGLCLAVDFVESNLKLVDIVKVDYRDEKVQIPPWFLDLTNEERNKYYSLISSRKGTEWSYEVEHRLV